MRVGLSLCLLAGCTFHPPAGQVDASAPGDGEITDGREPEAPADAEPDAAPAACPGDYVEIAGLTSRYRLTSIFGGVRTAHDDCKDDLVGHTHLVTLQSKAESDAVRARFNTMWWVGIVQAPGQATVDAGWTQLDGGDVPDEVWAEDQPNDNADNSENDEQNIAVRRSGGVEDYSVVTSAQGVCECDHIAIDPTVEGYIP